SNYELRAVIYGNDEEVEAFRSRNEAFMERYPNIQVELIHYAKEEAYKHLAEEAMLGGEAADIFLLDNTWVNEFAAKGMLAPIAESSAEEGSPTLIPAFQRQVQWNGYIWGMPLDSDPYVLVWNRNALAPYRSNEVQWTYEEMSD